MQSKATTVKEYIESLPADRKEAVSKIHKAIKKKLPKGYKEGMLWGMICYHIPLDVYADTYNKQPLGIIAVASQKNYMAIYMMPAYMDETADAKLKEGFKKIGKKLDMGKSCIRFKKLEDIPLDVITDIVSEYPVNKYIRYYEEAREIEKKRK